jgi:hypothetical protein
MAALVLCNETFPSPSLARMSGVSEGEKDSTAPLHVFDPILAFTSLLPVFI